MWVFSGISSELYGMIVGVCFSCVSLATLDCLTQFDGVCCDTAVGFFALLALMLV